MCLEFNIILHSILTLHFKVNTPALNKETKQLSIYSLQEEQHKWIMLIER